MMRAIPTAILFAAMLSACSVLPDSDPRRGGGPPSQATSPSRPTPARPPQIAGQCMAELGQAGVSFSPVADRYAGDGCSIVGAVQMASLQADYSPVGVSNIGPVQCEVGNAFAAWARFGADRAARQILGSGIDRIETMGSYSCRNVAGSGRRSAHATAGAIDIGAFVLADGRRISVRNGWNGGNAAEREFLRTVQRSACKRFATVLGPDYNAAHEDHLHLEGVGQGDSFCR